MSLVQDRLAQVRNERAQIQQDGSGDSSAESEPTQDTSTASNDGAGAKVLALPGTVIPSEEQIKRERKNAQAEERESAEEAKRKTAEKMTAVFDPFRDQHGNFWLRMGHKSVPLDSTHAGDIIRTAAQKGSNRLIGKELIDTVRAMLREAARDKPVRVMNRRVGVDGDDYLIDVGDDDGSVIRIGANGAITTEAGCIEPFHRHADYAELPMPELPPDAATAWDRTAILREGIPPDDQLPVIAAKVEHLRCDSPNTILSFLGPEGSSKTTIAKRQMQAIDPFTGHPPSVELDPKAVISAAQARYSVLFDNLSGDLPKGFEDQFCRATYGAATTMRTLYTTADSTTLPLFVAIHITGIAPTLRQADTLDRTYTVRVRKPSAYRSEAALDAEWRAQHPRVLGALLFLLAETQKHRDVVLAEREWKHRMIDFAVTGEIIARALGHPPGYFLTLIEAKRQRAARDWIEGDGFASLLGTVVAAWLAKATVHDCPQPWRNWAGGSRWHTFRHQGRVLVAATAEGIRRGMAERDATMYGTRSPVPTTARATTGALGRVQGALVRAGWIVELRHTNGGGNAFWLLSPPPPETS